MPVTDAAGKVREVVDLGQLIGFKDYVVVAIAVEFGEPRVLQGFLWRSLERRPSKIAAFEPAFFELLYCSKYLLNRCSSRLCRSDEIDPIEPAI